MRSTLVLMTCVSLAGGCVSTSQKKEDLSQLLEEISTGGHISEHSQSFTEVPTCTVASSERVCISAIENVIDAALRTRDLGLIARISDKFVIHPSHFADRAQELVTVKARMTFPELVIPGCCEVLGSNSVYSKSYDHFLKVKAHLEAVISKYSCLEDHIGFLRKLMAWSNRSWSPSSFKRTTQNIGSEKFEKGNWLYWSRSNPLESTLHTLSAYKDEISKDWAKNEKDLSEAMQEKQARDKYLALQETEDLKARKMGYRGIAKDGILKTLYYASKDGGLRDKVKRVFLWKYSKGNPGDGDFRASQDVGSFVLYSSS